MLLFPRWRYFWFPGNYLVPYIFHGAPWRPIQGNHGPTGFRKHQPESMAAGTFPQLVFLDVLWFMEFLVGGFNPSEKSYSQIGNLPPIGLKITKYLKPPPIEFARYENSKRGTFSHAIFDVPWIYWVPGIETASQIDSPLSAFHWVSNMWRQKTSEFVHISPISNVPNILNL